MFGHQFTAKKSNAQKVAHLIMKHSGCHQLNIAVLSSKHRQLMNEKKPYNPSHLSVCIPVVNKCSSKGLRSSDGSKKSSVVPETSIRHIRRELLVERPRHEKPRPSDAFIKVPLRIPETFSDADDESADDDLLRSRRRTMNSLRITIKPCDIIEKKHADLPLPTEDDELMDDNKKFEMKHANLRDFTVSGRFEIKDRCLCKTSKRSLVFKRRRGVCKTTAYGTIIPDPTAKVMKYSSDTDILYQDDCDCHFCSLLRHYNGCPLLFAREFRSDKGHGFFTKL